VVLVVIGAGGTKMSSSYHYGDGEYLVQRTPFHSIFNSNSVGTERGGRFDTNLAYAHTPLVSMYIIMFFERIIEIVLLCQRVQVLYQLFVGVCVVPRLLHVVVLVDV
jgi:hypothetical protein